MFLLKIKHVSSSMQQDDIYSIYDRNMHIMHPQRLHDIFGLAQTIQSLINYPLAHLKQLYPRFSLVVEVLAWTC